jgi:glucokinase
VPVCIENDANTAALGEKWVGAGRDFKSFAMLPLGTGIGGGIIYNGRLLQVASEPGHTTVEADGIRCRCGNTGCLESYSSSWSMVESIVSAIENGTESSMRECCKGNFYRTTPEEIYRYALDGDSLARETLKRAGRYLGIGIANLINLLSPEAVILGGGLIGAWNIYVEEAIKEASKRSFPALFEKTKIIPAGLEDEAGMIGAAYMMLMEDDKENP